jgi:3-oxoacyl-[acyl-carrier protein] reductase
MRLKGKVAVVTGGGRGIGREIALRFGREGASVAVAARSENELAETVDEIISKGGLAISVPTDVSEEQSVHSLLREIVDQFGTVDILVNDAGVQLPIGSVATCVPSEWLLNVRINLFGTFLVAHIFLPLMIERRRGKIINLSGGGATSARPQFSAYAASKAAVVRFTETLAEEVRQYGIDVNAIAPGAVHTKMLDEISRAGDMAGKNEAEGVRRQLQHGGTSPGRAVELALFLASEDSGGITGKLISAPWDPWRETSFQNKLRMDEDFATLRRIDERHFFRK